MKVLIKVCNENGKYLLNEIQGLKEGMIVDGKYNHANGAVDFKWRGLDAVVWMNINCVPYVPTKHVCHHQLPRGWRFDSYWMSSFNEGGETKSECIKNSLFAVPGTTRNDFIVHCILTLYNPTTDIYSGPHIEADTLKEAAEMFWNEWEQNNWSEKF